MAEPNIGYARATIHLPGFPFGMVALVDFDSLYVQNCLKAGFLVRVYDDPDEPGDDPDAQ